ncbi:MAG: hypothetical protein HY308_01480 [Gammaproteobacteria bacterium]|nr:hypothetical protein [Gammaproteobacteria bacterium]
MPNNSINSMVRAGVAALLMLTMISTRADEAEVTDDARAAGHAVGSAIHEVGHGAREVTRTIGHAARDTVKTGVHAVKEGGKELKRAVKGEE